MNTLLIMSCNLLIINVIGGGQNTSSNAIGNSYRTHSMHRAARTGLSCAFLSLFVLTFSAMCCSCGTKGADIESPADERAALLEELAASEAALLDSNVVKGSPEYEALLRHDDSLLFLIYGETLEEDL